MTGHPMRLALAAALSIFAAMAAASNESGQVQIDACIERLRTVGGPDGQSGEVVRTEFSEAATLVVLRDGGGTVWECLAYRDGSVGDMRMAAPGSDAAAPPVALPEPERIAFAPGTSGADLTRSFDAGGAMQFTLDARSGQFLDVSIAAEDGAPMYYQIINPDGARLLDGTDIAQPYRGQLWQDGDHVIEIVSQSSAPATATLSVGIE